MFNTYRAAMHSEYNNARNHFISNPDELIALEKYMFQSIKDLVNSIITETKEDYNEATHLYPFWAEYPPENRGRKPVGDQIPWLEVGEHSVGHKIRRHLGNFFNIRDIGIPSGPDDRFSIQSDEIRNLNSITDTVMVFLDTKSVGPRDDKDEVVASPNQISGDGIWINASDNLKNSKIIATGKSASHDFFPAVPPIFVLSNGAVLPVIHIFVKPIYQMLHLTSSSNGQPLGRLRLSCVPNGLLLTQNPNYLNTYPSLFYPGKDDKNKDPKKMRARVDLGLLETIAPWRNTVINL
jgi:hypothetical protein